MEEEPNMNVRVRAGRIAVAGLALLSGVLIPAIARGTEQSTPQVPTYTGCLTAKHTIVKVALGQNPSSACAQGQSILHVSGGTITSGTAGMGLTIDGSSGDVSGSTVLDGGATFGLQPGYQLPQACSAGQFPAAATGGSWTCADDKAYTAGLGLSVDSNGVFSVDTNLIQARVSDSCPTGSAIGDVNPDGSVDCATAFQRMVVVSPVPGGSPTDNGTALLAALSRITNASPTNPYVLFIEPGVFDLGSQTLVMKPDVDLQGSGPHATLIQSATSWATIQGQFYGDSAELRQLSVADQSVNGSAIGILDRCMNVSDVDVTVSSVVDKVGSVQGIQVLPVTQCAPRLSNVEVTASGRLIQAYGVAESDTSCDGYYGGSFVADHLTATAEGAGGTGALTVFSGTARLTASDLEVPLIQQGQYSVLMQTECGNGQADLVTTQIHGEMAGGQYVCTAYSYLIDLEKVPDYSGCPPANGGG
jgi:hypothetical protein